MCWNVQRLHKYLNIYSPPSWSQSKPLGRWAAPRYRTTGPVWPPGCQRAWLLKSLHPTGSGSSQRSLQTPPWARHARGGRLTEWQSDCVALTWTLNATLLDENNRNSLTQGRGTTSARRWFSTSLLRKLTEAKRENEFQERILKKWSNDNIRFPIKLTYSINTRVLLTFVETSSDVSSWSSQENPENHGAGHQSPTIGWREEPQAGENYQRHSLSITTRRMEDSSIIELITRSL